LIILKVKLVNTSILVFHESGKCFMDIQMYPIYSLILIQCSLAKVVVHVVGRIYVVMAIVPLILKMECLIVSFCFYTYYIGQPS
jgi:ABC-type glucose/galactose transport system permease subunit